MLINTNIWASSIRSFSIILFLVSLQACKDKPISQEQVVPTPTNESTASTNTPNNQSKKSILFFGDSLTAGYGLSEEESFPSLIQDRIDSLGYEYNVINAGLSGETTAGGVGRIDWVLQQPVDIFVLELGANDMLRGLDVKETKKNLESIINTVQSKYPAAEIIMVGMQSPPNMGPDYADAFNNSFSDLSKKHNLDLIPFLLEGVAGNPNLNLPDGKHPNAVGQKIVLENVWSVLKNYIS